MMHLMSETVIFHCPSCRVCGNSSEIQMVKADLDLWKSGEYVQNVFPWMTPDEREVLISGTHPACWTRLFGEDGE